MMPARVSEPQAAALRWMDGLLRGCGIPYQMTGDVAVVAHGAARPVRDIELFVAAEHVPALLLAAREHVVDPWRRLDDRWDLVALVLEHDGVRIDVRIADAARCRDAATGAWREAAVALPVETSGRRQSGDWSWSTTGCASTSASPTPPDAGTQRRAPGARRRSTRGRPVTLPVGDVEVSVTPPKRRLDRKR